MKRILSVLLVLTLVCGIFTTLCGLPVLAEADYKTEVWKPVEITFTSSVEYSKPYISTEIDAVFTHTDGTTITLPGFWKEGDTWAVRFSPTKVGQWSYKVTCKDTANTGLNGEGTIEAVASTSEEELHKRGFIKVQDNTRYYMYDDGTPFFWLGDTNWQAFSHVSTEVCNYPGCDCGNQFKHTVDNRKEKGFNVYQTYFIPGSGNGEKSVWKDSGKFERPNEEIFNEKVDKMFEYLNDEGFVIALGLGCHNATMTLIGWDSDTYLRFARYIVARYACYSIVWISGQEINDKMGSREYGKTVFEAYMEMSAKIEELDGYKHPNSAHTYPGQATGELYVTLDKQPWHDSWTMQGGHGGYVKSKQIYKSYYNACNRGIFKPFIESENNYEDINCSGFTGYDANRMSAWTAVLCGSAGFTYGVTGIWANCFSTSTFTGWFDGKGGNFNYEPWYMGLNKPGSYEMTYMRQFFETIPEWWNLKPVFYNIGYADFVKDDDGVLSSTSDASTMVAYFYDTKDTKTGTIKSLDKNATYTSYWFNPLTGKFILIEKDIKSANGSYVIPERPTKSDWVFLITTADLGVIPMEEAFVDLNPNYDLVQATGSMVTPVSVTAIGGISYTGNKKDSQTMTDNTSYLYDNDPATVWKPFIDRPTQTFIFDLGNYHDLSSLVINTVEGTTLPCFRVEGSNDLKDWTIITNTVVRNKNSNDRPTSASEPLKGIYRYVKVILLNPETIETTRSEVKNNTLPYKAYWNMHTHDAYYVTEITDLAIYSNGISTPVPTPGNNDDVVNNEKADSTWVWVTVIAIVTVAAVAVVGTYLFISTSKNKKKED